MVPYDIPVRIPDSYRCMTNDPISVGIKETNICQVSPEGRPVLVDVIENGFVPSAAIKSSSHLPLATKSIDHEIICFIAVAITATQPVLAATPTIGAGNVDLNPHMSYNGIGEYFPCAQK